MNEQYTPAYFDAFKDSSRASAEVVVPIVQSWIKPRTVVDMGCGLGMWLSVWQESGCEVSGVDGDWVDRGRLAIPGDRFIAHDLSQPYTPDGRYDLATSLEAADTLPAEAAAPFVHAITAAAPVVLFSASAPDQPGINHINCQWPS
ncbi:MAG: methyltransferase domain-containing protein [Gemmatimonadaceae bacterium]|nr:methyltransferase domain-containing protein [Gemmatimonadaceae bacterium]